MSSPAVTQSGTLSQSTVGNTLTLTDATAGVKNVKVYTTGALAGNIFTVSCQNKQLSTSNYVETDRSFTFSNPVVPTADPGAGYQPLVQSDAEIATVGYQVVVTFLSGTTSANTITVSIESL